MKSIKEVKQKAKIQKISFIGYKNILYLTLLNQIAKKLDI